MVILRADPWAPDYGMSFEAGLEEPTLALVDAFVERASWDRPVAPAPAASRPLRFIDGVRRLDLWLIARDGERRGRGLFGSFAVGSVHTDDRATFGDHRVCRSLVVGGGVVPDPVEAPCGASTLRFEPAAIPGSDPNQLLNKLQDLMREAEATLTAAAAAEQGCLVLVDGPLGYHDPTSAPVVGVVKRSLRTYLPPPQEQLLGRLGPGERTPVFANGEHPGAIRRITWYTRLAPFGPPWHDHAGVVRCEVRAGLGVAEAVRLADLVTAILPRFAGRPGDPRTPQNLVPVGALEGWLRHRMGDRALVRRALLRRLDEGG